MKTFPQPIAIRSLIFAALTTLLVGCGGGPLNLKIKTDVSLIGSKSKVSEGVYSGTEKKTLRSESSSELTDAKKVKVIYTLDFSGDEMLIVRDRERSIEDLSIEVRSNSFKPLKAVNVTVLVAGVGKIDRWYKATDKSGDFNLSVLAVLKDKSR